MSDQELEKIKGECAEYRERLQIGPCGDKIDELEDYIRYLRTRISELETNARLVGVPDATSIWLKLPIVQAIRMELANSKLEHTMKLVRNKLHKETKLSGKSLNRIVLDSDEVRSAANEVQDVTNEVIHVLSKQLPAGYYITSISVENRKALAKILRSP